MRFSKVVRSIEFIGMSLPFNAITLDAGFMIAESAEMGLLVGLVGSAMSTMTTWAVSPTFSLIQMYLSDSMVNVEKPMLAALIPILWSYERKRCKYSRLFKSSFAIIFSLGKKNEFSGNPGIQR